MRWIWHWIVSTIAMLIIAWLFKGISFDSLKAAFLASLVLGIINTFIRPILQILSLPITILTFGLFALIINAGMLILTSHLVRGFHIHGFITAFFASIVLSIVGSLLHMFLEDE